VSESTSPKTTKAAKCSTTPNNLPAKRPLTPSKSNDRTHLSVEVSLAMTPQVLNGNLSRDVMEYGYTNGHSSNIASAPGRSTVAGSPNLPHQQEDLQSSFNLSSQFTEASLEYDGYTGLSTLMTVQPQNPIIGMSHTMSTPLGNHG
jgi:hypothetical protein